MPKKKPTETPVESFERLRQCFDCIKENHTDPWCWHEYLNNEEPEKAAIDADDPEGSHLAPNPRSHVERLKTHLLACVSELQRASQAADMCFYHMSTSPSEMKECVIILGTSGDIDEDMLKSGDASPQKILAALQEKLNQANANIAKLHEEIADLKERLVDKQAESANFWRKWQTSKMQAEEAIHLLDKTSHNLAEEMKIKAETGDAYNKLRNQHTRCDRLMKYQGREVMRVTFKANKKENMFYAFVGFCYVLTEQKKERIRKEMEARRDAVEFSLKNEVKFLIAEIDRRGEATTRLAKQNNRMKLDRRELAYRMIHKNRPYEPLEYCLWAWELWHTVIASKTMRFEKSFENAEAEKNSNAAQLVHIGSQVPALTGKIDILKRELAQERMQSDLIARTITVEYAKVIANMWEKLYTHRFQEITTLDRLHVLDCESKDERIAVLERDIAEDKHIQALKGMVVDLESRLRKALDRRKQKGLVVPPGTGMKCSMCQREVLHRNWKPMPKAPDFDSKAPILSPSKPSPSPQMGKSASEADLSDAAKTWRMGLEKKFGEASFAPVWRPV